MPERRRRVKLALNLVRIRPDRMPELAARAEALGYESVFVPDHLAFPVHFDSKYPGTPDGSFPFPRDTPLYAPWIVLAQLARATSRIRLGTAIYLLALRHPIAAARAVTTLDLLSGGRAILGIGVGWLAEEFAALGIDPRTRFSRTEEAVRALRALWTEPQPEFHGRHFDFGPVHFEPKPVCKPHPPILFGGDSEKALQRALRLGDGWLSGGTHPDVDWIAGRMARIAQWRTQLGSTRTFGVSILDANPKERDLVRMAELGVERVVVMPWATNREAAQAIESFAAKAHRLGVT
jgi:probable F420-dependent oxidoreductase